MISKQLSAGRWRSVAIGILLLLGVWAVFGQTLRHEFINYDDDIYIYENPNITGGLSLNRIIWVFTHDSGLDEWFPLTDASHMLDWQIYGSNAGGHHLTNVLLHAAAAVLLFFTLQQMTGAMWRSACVAAIFAIHPLQVESVAWVTERKDVLSGLFFMLTLWLWTLYVQKRPGPAGLPLGSGQASPVPNSRPWVRYYYLALGSFALGLLSKNMLVTLPFVLLLLDYWPFNRMPLSGVGPGQGTRQGWRALILEKMPFVLLGAAGCLATVQTQRLDVHSVNGLSLRWQAGNAALAYVDYLGHWIYPAGLALLYPHPETHLPVGRTSLSFLVLFLITVAVLAGRRKHPYLTVGWFWYLGMLVPVIDFMQTGDQARADRYTYLPQIGLSMLLVWGIAELVRPKPAWRPALAFATAAILAGLLAAAHAQAAYWQDSLSIWTRTLACTPQSSVAHCNLGIALATRGKPADAMQHFDRALQINPEDARTLDNLGKLLLAEGKPDLAAQDFTRALQLDPEDAKTLNNLGTVLAGQGKLADAVQMYQRALQVKPDYVEARYNLGNALANEGNLDAAVQAYQQVLQLKPDDSEARNNLNHVLAAKQPSAAAAQYYEGALQSEPNNPDALNNWGVMLARQGKLDEAIQDFEQAVKLKPDDASSHNNLGIALASEQKWDESFQQFQQALNLARAQGNTSLEESIRERIKTYQAALPAPLMLNVTN